MKYGYLVLIFLLFISTASASVQVVASNNIKFQNTSTTPNQAASYNFELPILENISGSYNVSVQYIAEGLGQYCYAGTAHITLTKNGVTIGSEKTSSAYGSWVFANWSISGQFNTSDKLNVTVWATGSGNDDSMDCAGTEYDATAQAKNFQVMYDYDYPAGYQIFSFNDKLKTGFNDSSNIMDVNNGDVRLTGTGLVLSNTSYVSNDIVFDYNQTTTSSVLGIVFAAQNTSSFYHVRYTTSGQFWQMYCFSASCSEGATTLRNQYNFANPQNTSLRGRITRGIVGNSTFFLYYANGSLAFSMQFNATQEGWNNGFVGVREGGGNNRGAYIDNIGVNLSTFNLSDNFETNTTANYTNIFQSLQREQIGGNWVYTFSDITKTYRTYRNDNYSAYGVTSIDFNFTNFSSNGALVRIESEKYNSTSMSGSFDNFYGFQISNNSGTPTLTLLRRANGVDTTLNSVQVSISQNTTNTLKTWQTSDGYLLAKVWQKDEIEPGWQVTSQKSAPNITTGFIGVATYLSTGYFDNLSSNSSYDSSPQPISGDCTFTTKILAWGNSTNSSTLKTCLDLAIPGQSYLQYTGGVYRYNSNIQYNGTDWFNISEPTSINGNYQIKLDGHHNVSGATITQVQSAYGGNILFNGISNSITNSIFTKIYLNISTNFTYNNNSITDAYGGAGDAGLTISNNSFGVVNNSNFNQTRQGILVLSENNIQVTNNNFTLAGCPTTYNSNGCAGVVLRKNNSYIYNNIFNYYGNVSINTVASGIWSSDQGTSVGNTTIYKNGFYNTSWAGIIAYTVHNWTIRENQFSTTFFAVNSRYMTNSSVYDNIILNSTTEDNALIDFFSNNNLFKNNTVNGGVNSGWGIFIAQGSTNNTLESNIVSNFHRLTSYDPIQQFWRNGVAWDYALSSYGYRPFNNTVLNPVFINNVGYFTIPNTANDVAFTIINFSDGTIFKHDSYSNISYLTPSGSYIYSDRNEMLRVQDCGIKASATSTASFNVSYCDMVFLNKTQANFTSSVSSNNINLTVNVSYPSTQYNVSISNLSNTYYTSNTSGYIQFNFSNFTESTRTVTIEKSGNPVIVGYGGVSLANLNVSLENVSILTYHDSDFWNKRDNKEYFIVGDKYNYNYSTDQSSDWTCANSSAVGWSGTMTFNSSTNCYITNSAFNEGWIDITYKTSSFDSYGGAVFDWNASNFYKFGVRTRDGQSPAFWTGDLTLTNGSGGVQYMPWQYTTRQSETSDIYYTYRANITLNKIELWRTYGKEITYDSQNISEDGSVDINNKLFNFTRFVGNKIGINFTGNGTMTVRSFRVWGDASPNYGNITYTPTTTIQNFRYLGSGNVDLYRKSGSDYVLVQSDVPPDTLVNMLNTASMRLKLKTNTTRISSFLLTEDVTAPASITNNQTYVWNFGINNTWSNPADSDFDHIEMRNSTGELLSNFSNQSWNRTLSPQYTQNISAQTVDASGNVNQTLIWFNATTNSTPLIISWSNTKTNNQSISFQVNITESITFNATSNQAIANWTWYKDDYFYTINGNNITHEFLASNRTVNITVYGTNPNGTTQNITWSVYVFDNGSYIPPVDSPSFVPYEDNMSGFSEFVSNQNHLNYSDDITEVFNETSGSGSHWIDYYINSSSVTNASGTFNVTSRIFYLGQTPHILNVTLYNFTSAVNDNSCGTVNQYTAFEYNNCTGVSNTHYRNASGVTIVRINHTNNGVPSHRVFVDEIKITLGTNATPLNYTPPTPINLAVDYGIHWVNYSWANGTGNVTNTFNVSITNNSIQSWRNGSSQAWLNSSISSGQWSNISVYAFNSSGTGSLNATPISMNYQLYNWFTPPSPICSSVNGTDFIELTCTQGAGNITDGYYFLNQNNTDKINQASGIWNNTGLTPGTTYYYDIYAINGTNNLSLTPTSTHNTTVGWNNLTVPNITAYFNNITGWNQTALSINVNNPSFFNVTVNQSIATVSFKINGTESQNTSSLIWNHTWSVVGVFNVTMQANNSNGSSQTVYTIVTVTEGGSPPPCCGGGGNDWDWAYGYARYPNGTGIPSVAVTTPNGTTSTNGAGYYSFGYIFLHGSNVSFNFSKSGFDYNLTFGNFASGDYQIINATMNVTATPPATSSPIILTKENNITNDSATSFMVNKSTTVMFNFTANQSLTGCSWTGIDVQVNCTTSSYAYKNFTVSGIQTVTAQGTNANGSTQVITWTITVNGTGNNTVSGYVMNVLDVPLQNARVDLDGSTHVFTSATGYYSFTGVLDGSHTFLGRAIGYRNSTNTSTILGDTTMNFTMKEKSTATVSTPGMEYGIMVVGLMCGYLMRRKRDRNL